jgi:hypothetical protein
LPVWKELGYKNLFTELEDKRLQQNKNVKERDPWDDLGEDGTAARYWKI